jgi:hypothetical protein
MNLRIIPSPARIRCRMDFPDMPDKSPSRGQLRAGTSLARVGLLAMSLTCIMAQAQDSDSKAIGLRDYIGAQYASLPAGV